MSERPSSGHVQAARWVCHCSVSSAEGVNHAIVAATGVPLLCEQCGRRQPCRNRSTPCTISSVKATIRKSRRAWNDPGHAHYVTYSCHRRMPLLNRDRVRAWVIDALRRARERLDLSLWAYVIMPEHVHVLLYPNSSDYEMRRILAAFKRPVAKAAHQWLIEHVGHGEGRVNFLAMRLEH